MKKYILLVLTLVLTAAVFTGCGCTSQDAQYTTAPTTRPPMTTIAPTTQATAPATTQSTTQSTIDRGNGALDSTTGTGAAGTTDGTMDPTEQTKEGRTRQMQPSMNTK